MPRFLPDMDTKLYLIPLAPFRRRYPQLSKRESEREAGERAVQAVIASLWHGRKIIISREGKPRIKDCPYQFNLSHSGDYLALAVGETPLGIDIEKIAKIRPKVLEKCFSPAEQRRVQAEGAEAFYEIWCKKESYAKYLGQGIGSLLQSGEYPDTVDFYVCCYDGYQIAVCADPMHLPQEITMLSLF